MPKTLRVWTQRQLENLKPGTALRKVTVAPGLHLRVLPSGVKSWSAQPYVNGKRRTYALGRFPVVPLESTSDIRGARDRLLDLQRSIAAGKDPTVEAKAAKAKARAGSAQTCDDVFQQWLTDRAKVRSFSFRDNAERWWRVFLQPAIGALNPADVTAPMIAGAMENADKATSRHAAHSVRQLAVRVLDQAIRQGLVQFNAAHALRGYLDPHQKVAHAAMRLDQARTLYRMATEYDGVGPSVGHAVQVALLTALRASEIAALRTEWVDLPGKTLTLPRSAMKVKKPEARGPFVIPLSRQVLAVIREAMKHCESPGYLFPSPNDSRAPIERSALNAAIDRMLPDEKNARKPSPHSIRNCFSTWAHDTADARPDLVEACLDHARGNESARAYNRGTLLTQRATLLQQWADAVTA